MIDMCVWAEREGFENVVLHEHHNTDDGYLPAPIVLAAAIASRTRRIRIVLSAVVAPLHDPVRLAEELAVLDQVSGGRLTVVLVAGSRPAEFGPFGVDFAERAALLEETVETLRQAWTGKPFQRRGHQMQVLPQPVSPGGPPLLLGGMTPGSARRAARLGTGYQPVMPQLRALYLDELRRLGATAATGSGFDLVPVWGSSTAAAPELLHVASDPDAVWPLIAPHAVADAGRYQRWAASPGTVAAEPDADEVRRSGRYLVLDPDAAAELLIAIGPAGGVGVRPLLGGIDPALAWESLELLSKKVLPAVRASEPAAPAGPES